MKTSHLAVILVFVVGLIALWYFLIQDRPEEMAVKTDQQNATYVIEGQPVQLVDGQATAEAAPGSATKVMTRSIGKEVRTDLNGDGREDVAFVLTQESGGSGTFFYVVAALNTPGGYVGSESYLLGDRIAFKGMSLVADTGPVPVVEISYNDRALETSMSELPTVAKTLRLRFDTEAMQWQAIDPEGSR